MRASEARMPVMAVHDLGSPAPIDIAQPEMRCYPAEGAETQWIVGPFVAIAAQIRIAGTIVESRCIDDIGRHVEAGEASAPNHDRGGAERGTEGGHRRRFTQRAQ